MNFLSHLPKTAKRNLEGSFLALLIILLVSVLFATDALKQIEWQVDDMKAAHFRADTQANKDVIVLLVDEASLATMDSVVGQWPWPRSVWADVLEFMAMGEAHAVAFDILFTERKLNEDKTQSEHDIAFKQLTEDSGIAIHAMQILHDPSNPVSDQPLPDIFEERFSLPNVEGMPSSNNNTYYIPFKGLFGGAKNMGIVEFSPDPDGMYRRTNLFRDYLGNYYPVLSTAPLLDKMGITEIKGDLNNNRMFLNDMEVPLDRDGHYQVNFYKSFESYSIGSVLASIAQLRQGNLEALYTDDRYVSPELFTDKVIFIGTSAVGLEDMKNTPVESRWPGVFLHASIASNLLNKEFLTQIEAKWIYPIIIFLVIITTFTILKFQSVWTQTSLIILYGGVYLGISTYLYGEYLFLLDVVPPILALFLSWLLLSTFLATTEGAERKRVRNMLSQYVSPAALNSVLDNYEGLAEAGIGKEEEMTVVFSDIRSFTTISESLSPADVVKLLNIHLEAMTQATFDHGGTMDKFIGDATMAFWGAPLPDPDHPLHATRAMIAMVKAVDDVNEELASHGIDPIAIGVGANTGKVILGNIGSSQKLDYTVIGDTVNLGSRLEGLTKQYGVKMLISEFTEAEIREQIPCALIDQVAVKGKTEPVKVYLPLADVEDPNIELAREIATLCQEAFDAYHAQDFAKAIELHQQLPDNPFEFFKAVYKERCEHYLQTPPPQDWDGVFKLTTK